MKRQFFFKLLIAGDASVGKTTLVHRFVDEVFVDTTTMTLGVDFLLRQIDFEDSTAQLQLWDIGGQVRFRFMVDKFIPGAAGALLLFDITSMPSFVNIAKWVQILRTHDHKLPIMLVGTKYDLEEFSMVGDYYAELTKKRFQMIDYVKTSAKMGLNVDGTFDLLVRYLIQKSGKLTEKPVVSESDISKTEGSEKAKDMEGWEEIEDSDS